MPSHTLRGQLNINKTWNNKHNIAAVAGAFLSASKSVTRTDIYFGYDEATRTYQTNSKLAGIGCLYLLRVKRIKLYLTLVQVALQCRSVFLIICSEPQKTYLNGAYSYKNIYTFSEVLQKMLRTFLEPV